MLYKQILPTAFAIRPTRIIGVELREYGIFTAPEGKDTYNWVKSCLNRVSLCGAGKKHKEDKCLIDILDKDGDIIQDYIISKEAFEYMRRQFKFKLETER